MKLGEENGDGGHEIWEKEIFGEREKRGPMRTHHERMTRREGHAK